jgi:8-oxo-dGTP pyrophosphatase MutT (NUDIX family)
MAKAKTKVRKQVAALPVKLDEAGTLRVMLITSRETKRLIIPKGWPMKGHKDYRAAAIEAQEEAGVIGRVHKKATGSYMYWKRRPELFELCRVKVFILEVDRQLPNWREREVRQAAWFPVEQAADLVDDPGLVSIIRGLPAQRTKKARIRSLTRTVAKRMKPALSDADL